MSYSMEFTESLIAELYVPGWNLGDVFLTDGIAELIEDFPQYEHLLEFLLASQLRGDYGLVNTDALDLQRILKARTEGRPFTGVFVVDSVCIKVVTSPSANHTVVCLQEED